MGLTTGRTATSERRRKHGFRKRMKTRAGRKSLARRRRKGRRRLAVGHEPRRKRRGG